MGMMGKEDGRSYLYMYDLGVVRRRATYQNNNEFNDGIP